LSLLILRVPTSVSVGSRAVSNDDASAPCKSSLGVYWRWSLPSVSGVFTPSIECTHRAPPRKRDLSSYKPRRKRDVLSHETRHWEARSLNFGAMDALTARR
jgi:hypothetical protein